MPAVRRRLSEDDNDQDDNGQQLESKRKLFKLDLGNGNVRMPVITDPAQLWAMAPSSEATRILEGNFSLHNLRTAQDGLAVYGWMLDGHTPQGQLDRWTRLFLLAQEIHSLHRLPTTDTPADITRIDEAGKMILLGSEEDLSRTENGLFRRLLVSNGNSNINRDSVDLEKLRLLAKASSTIRFYRACLGALKLQKPVFTADINPARVRRAIAQTIDRLDPKANDDYRRDLWSLHLTLGELCVYAQVTCSKFSRNIDVSAIVRRLPERSSLKLSDQFKLGSAEQHVADLWAFDLWLKTVCARNPGFVMGSVITWRLHCRDDTAALLLADSIGMRTKPPVIVMLGHQTWVVVDNKQKIWSAFDSPVDAIACFLLYTHDWHGSCFSNSVPLPALPDWSVRGQ